MELLKTKADGHSLYSEEEEPHKCKGCMDIQRFLIACHTDNSVVVPSVLFACHVRALEGIRLPNEAVDEGSTKGKVTNCTRYENKVRLVRRSLFSGWESLSGANEDGAKTKTHDDGQWLTIDQHFCFGLWKATINNELHSDI